MSLQFTFCLQLEKDVSSSIEDLENLFETEKVALLFLKAQSNTLIDGYLKLLDYDLYVNLFISSDSNFKLSFFVLESHNHMIMFITQSTLTTCWKECHKNLETYCHI